MSKENTTMTFSLPESMKEQIEAHISANGFGNSSEWFRGIARANLEHHQKLSQLRALVQAGIDALDRGEVVELTPELITSIKARGRERLAAPDHA